MLKFLQNIKLVISLVMILILSSCSKGFFKPGDARKNSPDPDSEYEETINKARALIRAAGEALRFTR